MRTMHLFAGIGGGLLADLILGHTPVVAVEWEPYACKVLRERAEEGWFPGLHVWEGDVRLFDPSEYTGIVDCIHAGFPCQDISVAGKQAGVSEGTRSGLYREVLRIAGVVRPKQLFLENVSAILSNGLGTVLGDLAALGYDSRWLCIRASDVGAPHHRDRWFLLADSDINGNGNSGPGRSICNKDGNSEKKEPRWDELSIGIESSSQVLADTTSQSANGHAIRAPAKHSMPGIDCKDEAETECEFCGYNFPESLGRYGCPNCEGNGLEDVSDTDNTGSQGRIQDRGAYQEGWKEPKNGRTTECGTGWDGFGDSFWRIEPGLGRVANGVPNRVGQLKGYGNAQVPLQAAAAYRLLGGV